MILTIKQTDEITIEVTFFGANRFKIKKDFHVDSPLSKVVEKIKVLEDLVIKYDAEENEYTIIRNKEFF